MLDTTRLLPGALATQYLADFGASVVKVEQPGIGDYARRLFAADGESPVFTATNRGKRSVAIDFKHPSGREAMLALVRTADVLIESFRPGVMDRLGLGFEALHDLNRRLIYAALTGYGQSGPMRDAAGHDINYLALSGVLDMIGEQGGNLVVPGVQIADIAGGAMQAAMGVLLALAARERTGEGQFVDVSMTRGAANLLTLPLTQFQTSGQAPARGEGTLSGKYACYGVYRCADGTWMAIGALEPKFWAALCRALGRPDLIGRQFEPGQVELKQILQDLFLERDGEEWTRLLHPHDCCATLVRSVAGAAGCNWLAVDQPAPALTGTPGQRHTAAPRLGEHTREVLREAGIPEPDIDGYFRLGAIA